MRRSFLFLRKIYTFLASYQISLGATVLIVTATSMAAVFVVWNYSSHLVFPEAKIEPVIRKKIVQPSTPEPEKKFIPQRFTMNEMKTKGCVADGILSGYGGDTKSATALINRSPCVYLHRALETWAAPPDFDKAEKVMDMIDKPHVVYGMFLAEALRKNEDVYWPEKDREFDFGDMCRSNTDNRWGEHTCIPSFNKEEYRGYLKYITERAMDLGIQSFMFGQIYLQDPETDPDESKIFEIVGDMRKYAQEKGLQIVVGAQTNNIKDERYLKLFDYIEGGVGIDTQGNVEGGPCLSSKGSCWALLWHPNYSSKANNVFLHLDWSGLLYDDMSKFARMDQDTREKTLKSLYAKFTSQGMGFMMPYSATINKDNNGCYGPMKRFYSPNDKYKCKDEDAISAIMDGKK